MSSTRETIIDAARKLFQEQGYDKVALRDIAGVCGISIGNLNYHFNKKEDLVMAVMEDFYKKLHGQFSDETDDTLTGFFEHLSILNDIAVQNQFYFKNLFILADAVETIRTRQIAFREMNYYYYLRTFKALRDNGILRSDVPEFSYDNVALQMILMQVVWFHHNSPVNDDIFSSSTYFKSLCACIYPFLTSSGVEMWNDYFLCQDNS